VSVWHDGKERRAESFRVVAYPASRGSAAAYYPETNVLVPLDSVADISDCPTSKGVVVRLEPTPSGGMNVIARLGLASADVTLATRPDLHGDWTLVVHPTLLETIGLHAALSVAINALHLANRLADV
jgi:hypothetical protein